MEKTTVLARLQYIVAFTEQTIQWINKYFPEAWFSKEEGTPLLSEFGGTWRKLIEEKINQEVQTYFHELGVSSNNMPYISHVETYRGSWIMDAAIVMLGSVGQSYAILKQAPRELSEIATGLSGLKNKIQIKIEQPLALSVSETLYSATNHLIQQRSKETAAQPSPKIPSPPSPSSLIATNFIIDARPLASLTPSVLKSHKIHLSIGVSRDSFTLENLGDDALRDVQLGVFRTRTPRHQWTYQDSYMGQFPLVSGRQTVTKQVGEFIDSTGNRLDFSDGDEAYVDCWVQDSHGIYIFQFFLEEER